MLILLFCWFSARHIRLPAPARAGPLPFAFNFRCNIMYCFVFQFIELSSTPSGSSCRQKEEEEEKKTRGQTERTEVSVCRRRVKGEIRLAPMPTFTFYIGVWSLLSRAVGCVICSSNNATFGTCMKNNASRDVAAIRWQPRLINARRMIITMLAAFSFTTRLLQIYNKFGNH